jgi:hypothetical protein
MEVPAIRRSGAPAGTGVDAYDPTMGVTLHTPGTTAEYG